MSLQKDVDMLHSTTTIKGLSKFYDGSAITFGCKSSSQLQLANSLNDCYVQNTDETIQSYIFYRMMGMKPFQHDG